MKRTSRYLVRVALFAALYVALTLVFPMFAYGVIQFRLSESLVLLPILFPESIIGLTIGCFLANIPSGLIDMVVGSIATLLACISTRLLKKVYLGIIPPVIFNAFLVPIIFLSIPDITTPYWYNVLTVGASEIVAVIVLAIPMYLGVKKVCIKKNLLPPLDKPKK